MVMLVSFCVVLWHSRRWPQNGRDPSVGSQYWTDIGEQRSGVGKPAISPPDKAATDRRPTPRRRDVPRPAPNNSSGTRVSVPSTRRDGETALRRRSRRERQVQPMSTGPVGRGRLVEMNQWDRDATDLVRPPITEITTDGQRLVPDSSPSTIISTATLRGARWPPGSRVHMGRERPKGIEHVVADGPSWRRTAHCAVKIVIHNGDDPALHRVADHASEEIAG
jgi:hypothetical protein